MRVRGDRWSGGTADAPTTSREEFTSLYLHVFVLKMILIWLICAVKCILWVLVDMICRCNTHETLYYLFYCDETGGRFSHFSLRVIGNIILFSITKYKGKKEKKLSYKQRLTYCFSKPIYFTVHRVWLVGFRGRGGPPPRPYGWSKKSCRNLCNFWIAEANFAISFQL